MAAETFLDDHPMSRYDEEVNYVLVDNSITLALKSVESKKKERIDQAIERYRTFAIRYPESNKLKGLNSRVGILESEKQNISSTK